MFGAEYKYALNGSVYANSDFAYTNGKLYGAVGLDLGYTEEEILANGVGHLQESSLPVGGENTHCILTGHRGLPNAKLFTRLDEMEQGDLFFLTVCGEKLAYEVTKIEIVHPEDVEGLRIQAEKDLVSLIIRHRNTNTQPCVRAGPATHSHCIQRHTMTVDKR